MLNSRKPLKLVQGKFLDSEKIGKQKELETMICGWNLLSVLKVKGTGHLRHYVNNERNVDSFQTVLFVHLCTRLM